MDRENKEQKKKHRKHSPIQTAIAVVCVILCLSAVVGGSYLAFGRDGKDGKNGEVTDDMYTVKTETVREYVTEYLSSPDGSQQIKQLTRDDIDAYSDTLAEYFAANNVTPTTDLSTIEKELLERLSDELIEKLDMKEIERLIDISVAAHLKDLQIGGVDTQTDYSAIISELRAKYDAEIEELTSMIEQMQGNFDDIKQYVTNTTVSVADVKVLEETINQLKTALEQLKNESNSLTEITNIFEQDLDILDKKVVENYNELTEQLAQTNIAIEEMHQQFTEDIENLTEIFGQQLTEAYDQLDQYITENAYLSEQRDLQLQQNLEVTANDIRNELHNNVDMLNTRLTKEVYDLNQRITNEVNDLNTRLTDLKNYVDGYVSSEINRLTGELNKERQDRIDADEALRDEIANRYEWSKDAYGQDKLTVTTPPKRN